MFDRGGLVRIQLLDSAIPQDLADPRVYLLWECGVFSGPGWQPPDGGHPPIRRVRAVAEAACEPVESRLQRDVVGRIGAPGWQHGGGDHKAKTPPGPRPARD